ncbi:RNA polymerase sigma factor [Caulobacter sp. 1776]|uniref:RNA polymerase sigma factor n=1 Tax=Caulobacter sp. 1776 TaxID=3156420 RepID=UPI00339A1A14
MRSLEGAAREAGGRIIAALAATFRDLDLSEEAFAEACARAAAVWPTAPPLNPAAWLYATARRCALDMIRKRNVRQRLTPDAREPEPTAEELLASDTRLIPDERLRLIFVCCHPAVAPEGRAALTLRLVCGLSVQEIARAFLVAEPAMFQRLTRAKKKIAEAGVSFEVPGPEAWPERLAAVLSTLEVAYARAHEDAAGAGTHAGFAREMLDLTAILAELLPNEPECLAFAALVRFAEARRPARLDAEGAMVPLSEQDPALWRRSLIEEGEALLRRAARLNAPGPRQLRAALHGVWCVRRTLADPPPWSAILGLYDLLLAWRDDPFVRINRAVALAEVAGPAVALVELEALDTPRLDDFQPFHAVRADLLARLGRRDEALAAYDRALEAAPGPAERLWLARRRSEVE